MIKKILEIIREVKKSNPYPKDIFIEPTKKQYAMLHRHLVNKNLTLDKFSGALGRKVWDNCCDTIIEKMEGE